MARILVQHTTDDPLFRAFAWFDRTRQTQPGTSIKYTGPASVRLTFILTLADGNQLTENDLTVTDEDILYADDTSVFVDNADVYLAKMIDRDRQVGKPVGVEGVDYYFIDSEDLPDLYFKDAYNWKPVDNQLTVDMPKARGMHMDKIRLARNNELTNLDVPFMKALEDGDTDAQATIKAKKQVLRDIPQTFDLTTDTADELKQKWPDGLPK